jgi:hypothetical protein
METEVEIDWESEYIGWQKSGLGQREYSERAGYGLSKFKNAMMRIGCRKRLKKTVPSTQAGFVELKSTETAAIEKEAPAEAYCEIRFNGKPGLRIESAETLGQLRGLVKGLWG